MLKISNYSLVMTPGADAEAIDEEEEIKHTVITAVANLGVH